MHIKSAILIITNFVYFYSLMIECGECTCLYTLYKLSRVFMDMFLYESVSCVCL